MPAVAERGWLQTLTKTIPPIQTKLVYWDNSRVHLNLFQDVRFFVLTGASRSLSYKLRCWVANIRFRAMRWYRQGAGLSFLAGDRGLAGSRQVVAICRRRPLSSCLITVSKNILLLWKVFKVYAFTSIKLFYLSWFHGDYLCASKTVVNWSLHKGTGNCRNLPLM